MYGGQQKTRQSLPVPPKTIAHYKISVDAFLLPQVTDTHFYLHCRVSVHNLVSATAKSCTYNNAEWRWEELYSDASVCDCCDSTCDIKADSYFPSMTQSLISSKPWILDRSQQNLLNIKGGWVSIKGDPEKKFKSATGIDEEKDDDGDTLEIVSDIEEQTEVTKENKKMSVMHLDEDVEVIVGSKEITATESVHSGHVKSDGKEMGRVLKIGEVAGRPRSRSGAGVMGELLEDVKMSSKSGINKMVNITKDEMDFKDLQVQSTVQSQMVLDEELFLNAKQEPAEWNKDGP